MPSAREVEPNKWAEHRILFDNGSYSVIAGKYDGREEMTLGERWNGHPGHGELGFPNVFGRPVWHVVPDFLHLYVLHGVLAELSRDPTRVGAEEQLKATLEVLKTYPMPTAS